MSNANTNNGYTVANADRYAPTTWGQKQVENAPFEYTTPSGQTCLIRSLGMDDILRMGMIDKLDFFAKSMDTSDKPVEEKAEQNKFAKAILSNFDQMEETINAIVIVGVIAPQIQALPEHAALKKDGVIYPDSIPFNDRIALFSAILDTEGLSTFRTESEDGVGDVPSVEDVQLPA